MNQNLLSKPSVLDVEMEDGIHRILASSLQEENGGYQFCGIDLTDDDGFLDKFLIDIREKIFLYDFNARISKSAFDGYMDLLMNSSNEILRDEFLMDHPEIKAEVNRAKHYDGIKECFYKPKEEELEI